MDFEEMKVIWDSQNEEPMYAINQSALQASIKRKTRGFRRQVLLFEFIMILASFGGGIVFLLKPIIESANYHQIISAIIFFGASAVFFRSIWQRSKTEHSFEQTLRGDLEKALWQVQYHISRSRALRLGFILPCCIAVLIDFGFEFEVGRIWFVALFLVLLGGATFGIEKEIRHCYMPKLRKLEALRETLMEAK